MHDYLTMLNARDGGIGGFKIVVEECETGYKNEKGVECYESLKSKKPVVITPYSTGITLALIPKAAVDHIPILSMAYGLSASAVGKDFPWIFNPPATYWDGLSIIFRYIGGKEGGLDKLKGKTIGFIYFDGGYGREPIPLLDQLAKDYGFEREEVSGAAGPDAEPVEPVAQRSPRPSGLHDHVGLGRDEPDRRAGSRQDRLSDGSLHRRLVVGQRGRRASGRSRRPRAICRSTSTPSAPNFPAIQDILKYRDRQGHSQTPKDKVGENFYNRGVMNAAVIAEAIRNAQKITGKKDITGEEMRRGLESLQITAARWKEIGLDELRGADRRSPAPTTTATTPPICSSGTAPSGSRSPTGSRR